MIYRILLVFMLMSSSSFGSHVLGGDITWECVGNQYVFQLVFYRDCNGAIANTAFENIEVWGHPSVNSIQVNYISSEDLSPFCNAVPGSLPPLDCGSGQAGGNGIGAIEKIIYRSNPTTLNGTPPAEGWVFTFQSFSRSANINNLTNPSNHGITLKASIFDTQNTGNCVDNSPQFLQDPNFVSCAGTPYSCNMNIIDPDLDSLHIQFGKAYDYFPGQNYTPPTIPAELTYEANFSFDSPTPDNSFDPGNSPSQLDPSSGNLTFLSNNSGNFIIKIVAQSFRNGTLIGEVEREIQVVVTNCTGNNNAPTITGPFGGLFETTVNAGDLVNFNLNSTDLEFLQDGTPQDNILIATGQMFGTNQSSTTGCEIAPCATLNSSPPITMSQGVTTNFNWQTSCDHLTTPLGQTLESIPYHYVFKVQDNYCQVPKVTYATVTINIVNPGVLPAPEIDCIQSDATGNVTLTWTPISDPLGTFSKYQLYSIQDGLIADIPNIATSTYVDPGVTQKKDYYLVTASACNGNTLRYSDTISNIYLNLNNANDGTAQLQWNDPILPALPGMNGYYHIYKEFPVGNWFLLDSVPFGTHFYRDTIDLCSAFFSYQIQLPNQPCDYTSNIEGDNFNDIIAPRLPDIYSVTIDSLTNEVTITWNQNSAADTYGYIVYVSDANGNIIELDQVFSQTDTVYTYSPGTITAPLTYSVAAFDSCLISTNPDVYQTSAKGDIHTTVFLSNNLDICNNQITLNWTEYVGWSNVDSYTVYSKNNLQTWSVLTQTTNTSFVVDVQDNLTYDFVIQAVSSQGDTSFSNVSTRLVTSPSTPLFNYLRVVTVENNQVVLRTHVDDIPNNLNVSIQKEISGQFTEVDLQPVSTPLQVYVDTDIDVSEEIGRYQVVLLDSCGKYIDTSNISQNIVLTSTQDALEKKAYLNWTPYASFDGSIIGYNIYRGADGVFGPVPINMVSNGILSYEDDISGVISTGKICYKIEAIEGMNTYNFQEGSFSNESCIVLPPVIYIPNAFLPDGVNRVFRPIVNDFNPSDYELIIFDRLGQQIFQTNDYTQGWDGSIQLSGKMTSTGTYIYLLRVVDGDGLEIIKRGHVSLLK